MPVSVTPGASAADRHGKVVGIAEVDTATVLDAEKHQYKIRLAGIRRGSSLRSGSNARGSFQVRGFAPRTAIQRVHFGYDEVVLVLTTSSEKAPAKNNLLNDSVAPVLDFYGFKGRRRGRSPKIQEPHRRGRHRQCGLPITRPLAARATPGSPRNGRIEVDHDVIEFRAAHPRSQVARLFIFLGARRPLNG